MLSQINSNLQHGLTEYPNVPSCSEEELVFLFPDHGCSNYHKEMQAFPWMGINSLHSRQSLIHFKSGACMDLVNIQIYHHKRGRATWLFLFRSQGCSSYHKEMQAFLWMGIISLHSRQSLIHFKSGACMDFANIQMYHHEGRRAWPFSFQMAGLFKLWHEKVSISRNWTLFQSDIANNLWFISNL